MKKPLFPEGRRFYKANLHCHTVISDGKKTPEEIKAMYVAEGYDAVAFTDHEALILHDDLTDDCFVALNGYETAVKEYEGKTDSHMKVHHLCLIKRRPHDDVAVCFYPENFTPGNCRSYIPFLRYVGERCKYEFTGEFVTYLIDEAHENGFLVHYNHPRWSLMTADKLLALPFDGLELCNTDCRFHGDYNADVYEDYLRLGGSLNVYTVGGDDNHNAGVAISDSFGAFTMIAARELSYEALTDALSEGSSYVSTGPSILSAYAEDGVLVIKTSPASHILLHSEGRKLCAAHGVGGYIDKAAFPLNEAKLGRYFRIEIVDAKGEHAYTRAYKTADFA